MLVLDVITFDLLSYYNTKLKNEINSTYVSKKVSITGPVYIGVGNSVDDIYINNNLQNDVSFPKTLSVNCLEKNIYVLYPASNTNTIVLSLNNFIVPMDSLLTTTLSGKSYYILKSSNTYNYSGKITFSIE